MTKKWYEFITEAKGLSKKQELEIGIIVEHEHVHNFKDVLDWTPDEIATKIANDHIKQDKNYYSKLIEAGLVDEKEAIDLYNKYKK